MLIRTLFKIKGINISIVFDIFKALQNAGLCFLLYMMKLQPSSIFTRLLASMWLSFQAILYRPLMLRQNYVKQVCQLIGKSEPDLFFMSIEKVKLCQVIG